MCEGKISSEECFGLLDSLHISKLTLLLLSHIPWLHTCPKTVHSTSVHIKNLYSQRIHFFQASIIWPSVNKLKENGLHLMTFNISLKKCGAIAPLIIHMVLVAAEDYLNCAIFESGSIFGSTQLTCRWLENTQGTLFSTISIAIFISARVTWDNLIESSFGIQNQKSGYLIFYKCCKCLLTELNIHSSQQSSTNYKKLLLTIEQKHGKSWS